MNIGDKVWVFDLDTRVYVDELGNETTFNQYRGHFVERYIVGETTKSWIIGYEGSNCDSRGCIKVSKKDLTYPQTRNLTGILYTSEEQINKLCWVKNNRYEISRCVEDCNDYDKLIAIQKILSSDLNNNK